VISTLLFAISNIPMLRKAIKTKEVRSYSRSFLVLSNVGNAVHWLYIAALPLGPIWVLHTFYSISMAVMLLWYVRQGGRRLAPC
jgi:hypothetical protein